MAVGNSALGQKNLSQKTTGAKGGRDADVQVAGYKIDGDVLSSIRGAAKKTGVNFSYLMAQAAQESSFNTDAKASSSSATGLYQFLDSTWMQMVKEHGGKHGLGQYANAIEIGRSGYTVRDPKLKQEILDLRKDAKIAAVIGAEFALGNKETLERNLNRAVGGAEMYLAHFLGAQGATKFLAAVDRNADLPAAKLMPEAAASNRNVFYDKETGRPRTVGEVFRMFSRSIEKKAESFASLEDGGMGGAVAAGPRAGKPSVSTMQGPRQDYVRFLPQAPSADSETVVALPTGLSNATFLTMLTIAALETTEGVGDALDKKDADGDGRVTAADARAGGRQDQETANAALEKGLREARAAEAVQRFKSATLL
ncbi:hypothetical protein GCM10011497_09040 [Elstera cyanobacteriorum]|uniref:Transglycosylase SLT domain-containing protein n=1 Tax=Elstera cyanobacteriorum TaxID=2022747 RepID=A0A255XJ79_9PROT|nr:transglycosylase SLT domain-containing protein [Elstera cyanobacteriorum]OYQ17017.1 hypothetical protein CHR90_18830 [Elstera cyanobacteriorum]GFZ82755.1 hypothetical protein GCM10011497_09040 [Elstera cyanobacteriorum]